MAAAALFPLVALSSVCAAPTDEADTKGTRGLRAFGDDVPIIAHGSA